jgi:hypothetical protein
MIFIVPFVVGFNQTIEVDSEWNDLSFEILPSNTSVENVLMSVNGSYQMLKGVQDGKRVIWHENMREEARTLNYFDFDGAYQIKMKEAATIEIIGYPNPLVPYLLNTTWSEWYEYISCNLSDELVEIRELVQYDYNNLDDNVTFNETRLGDCDYCIVDVINSSWSQWNNISIVYPNGTQIQTRNKTEHDANDCYVVTGLEDDSFDNETYFENRTLYYGPIIDDIDIDDVDPTSGGVSSVIIVAQISDLNGIDDIVTVDMEFVSGNPTNGDVINFDVDDCDRVDDDTIECIADYDMEYYDSPREYYIEVYTEDSTGFSDLLEDSFDYSSLVSLELDVSEIAFGVLALGETKELLGDSDWGVGNTTLKNQGNVKIDADVKADDFVSSPYSFGAEQVEIKFNGLNYFSLTNNYITETDLNLDYGISSITNVDFRINVPSEQEEGSYESSFNIIAVSDE